MKIILGNKYFLLVCRFILAFIFIFAGAEKIANPEGFAISISNYKLIPISAVNIFAITLPWIELITGILLLLGISVKENSFIILGFMIVFTLAVLISLFRGLKIDCGCFGSDNKIGLLKLLENSLMIFASILLSIFGSDLLKIKN